MGLFSQFPREIGKKRLVVHNQNELLNYVNKYNGIKDVYTSLYAFQELYNLQKITSTGNTFSIEKPNYSSAIVDKAFFDFDGEKSLENTSILADYLEEKSIGHHIFFSGGGFHIYIDIDMKKSSKLKNKKGALLGFQKHLINKLGLETDEHVIGDLARITRYPNTYNTKRKRFCIPLQNEELLWGIFKIKEMAKKQRFLNNGTTGKKINLKPFDVKTVCGYSEELPSFSLSKTPDLDNIDLPECVRRSIREDMGYRDRFLLILFLKEKGLMLNEVTSILKKVLNEKKFRHSMYEERQPEYIFSRDLMFPSCGHLKNEGRCPYPGNENCGKNNLYL